MTKWIEWRPAWCPNVKGEYTDRGYNLEQLYKARCETCGETWGPVKCLSGMVRKHIATFATQHTHRKPLSPIPPKP